MVTIGRSVDDLLSDPAAPSNADYSVEFCGGTHLADTSGMLPSHTRHHGPTFCPSEPALLGVKLQTHVRLCNKPEASSHKSDGTRLTHWQ